MDALIYTAMSGAERALHAQQVHANNLANLDTAGFRANMELATSQAVKGCSRAVRTERPADCLPAYFRRAPRPRCSPSVRP